MHAYHMENPNDIKHVSEKPSLQVIDLQLLMQIIKQTINPKICYCLLDSNRIQKWSNIILLS